ncbi:hypothetical protein SD70_07710 [Gordoniibacillus kamchatkensis]|uniref:HTH araC/xylS-type domain-containing protein n=1 Tax=Gordoniibacillus kamchatkensis TaxID=1590651 RepID=A0ABR5AK26_9BACL|nr:AraC family transcriptional regulator [Paenibacillus sp. VKM B-2647]KIL41331.1 hypothetical protein SD70_07710 [Paenibacillus sp. VKM B-2647]
MIRLIQAAFSNFKFRSLFFRILFLLALLVTMTTVVVGYFGNRYSQNVVREEVRRSSIQMLEQTRRLMDALLSDVDQITVRLAQNRTFSHALLSGAGGPSEADVQEIRNYLLDSYTSSPYIESIYVYYADSGLVQSALVGPAKTESTDDPEWLPYYRSMKRTESKWFVRKYPGGGSDKNLSQTQVTLIRTTPWGGASIKGAIIVNMNQQALFQSPSFRLMRPGEEIWMVSPDGSLAFNSNTGMVVPAAEFSVIRDKLGSDITAFANRFRGSEYSFTAVTSPYTGWKYVDLIPTASLYQSGKDIQQFMLILMAFSIVIAVLFAFVITIRIYSPIYSLVQFVNNKREGGNGGAAFPGGERSELAILFSAFKSLKEQSAAMESQLKDNWPVLQQSFLRRLIQEKSRQHAEIMAQFAYYRLPVTPFGFFVCVLRIDDYPAYMNKYGRYDQSLIRYFIAKMSAEMAGPAYRLYPLHTESRDVILVCNPEQEVSPEQFRAQAPEAAERIGAAIRTYLNLTVSAGIGDLKQLAGSVSESYEEAMDALESRAFKGYGLVAPIWLNRDRKPADQQFFRTMGAHKREILLHIREDNPEELGVELAKLADTAEHAEGIPFRLVQHACFQLVVEVFQRLAELGFAPKSETELSELQEEVLRLETVGETVRYAAAYIRRMNRRVVSETPQESVPVAKQILDYIEANFDKEISLGGIADKLQLDPSYVSRLFRQEVSVTFMDYVISLRLEKAKKLLIEGKLPVKQIGAAVGYANQRSFNRIFKKYEGVTPGEYRDIHGQNKLSSDEIY